MRIEKLNNDKIKVTLTTADLIKLDIDVEQLAPDSKELHTFLFHIMETIREETGFNPYSGQVVVEAMPSHDGISILVSRTNRTPSKRITRSQFCKATSVTVKKKKTSDMHVFYFNVFDDLCMALKELREEELNEGELYCLNDVFCYITSNSHHLCRCISILSEFSSGKTKNVIQPTYIREHGKLIAKNKDLAKMAVKIRQIT